MFVKLWMVEDVVTIGPKKSLAEAKAIFDQRKIRRLPVVVDGEVVGVLSRRDLERALPSFLEAKAGREDSFVAENTEVGTIMASPAVTIGPDETLHEAVHRMRQHKVDGLPVVADGKIVGLVAITDLLDAILELMETKGGGLRLVLKLDNTPDHFNQLMALIADHEAEVVAIMQHHGFSEHQQMLSLQLRGEDLEPLIDDIWKAGMKVERVVQE